MVFQIIGFVILALFYGCYFGKMLNQRKKGIETDQMGKGKVGFVKAVEMTLKVVTILAPLAEIVSIILNTTPFDNWLRIMGAVIGLLGVLVFAASVITMKDSWRAGVSEAEKTDLVTDGIYQISRNPAFLGFDLVYIGLLLMFFNWFLLGISALAMLMLHLQIVNVEEDFLIEAFGQEYLDYRKRVCRYLGRKFWK